MLSLKSLSSAKDAVAYYQAVLDYYAGSGDSQAIIAWQGKAVSSLFNCRKPTLEDFKSLLEGKLPNGQVLGRREEGQIHHRPGIDLTFSAPKSASILALIYGDKEIIKSHATAVTRTLKVLENMILHTRINGKPAPADKVAFAKFQEMLSREFDPQIHTHCVLLNLCQSMGDGKFRSIFSDSVLQNKMLGGVIYRSFLAIELQKLGYEIEITCDKATFEIKGIPKKLIDLFSKRSEQINTKAAEYGRFDPAFKAVLNLTTRKNKVASPLNIQQDKWQIEAVSLAQSLGASLDKGFEQFRTGHGHRFRDSDKIADEAIRAGLDKLDEFKRICTQQEIILEATRLSLGKVLPQHINAAFERAQGSGLIQAVHLNQHETSKRQEYYMSAGNAAIAHALRVNAKHKHQFNMRTKLIGLVASKWILGKKLSNHQDSSVYKKLIDFAAAQQSEIIVDNLCPKVDKYFLQRASDFSGFLGVRVFHVTISSINRTLCEQAGLTTWSLDYLHTALIKPGSILLVHGSEKILNAQMRDITAIAKKNRCKVIWANDKDINALDRRLSPVEQIADFVPRASFKVGLGYRLTYDYTLADSQPLKLENLGDDNFIKKFARYYSNDDSKLLLSYQKDTVNRIVRKQLVDSGKLQQGIKLTNYVHQYLSKAEIQRPASYQVHDIVRLNQLSLLGLDKPQPHSTDKKTYYENDHFKISQIAGKQLTLIHSRHQTQHQLNLEAVTHFKELTLFRERTFKVAEGDKLILPNFDIYGKDYQNKIGRVVSIDDNAITLQLALHAKPFVLHLKDKQGNQRDIYADHAYCVHPANKIQGISLYHIDCRASHSINVLRTLTAMRDKNVTLYTDSPQGVIQALESIKVDLKSAQDSNLASTEKFSSNTVFTQHAPNPDLKINSSTQALTQALHQLTADGKSSMSQWHIIREAMTLTMGKVDIHDMKRGFKNLLESGEIVKEGGTYSASWVIQYRETLIEAFNNLQKEELNKKSREDDDEIKRTCKIPELAGTDIENYLKKNNLKLSKAPIKAIIDITANKAGLALLQGPAGSAKTSLVLRHVAAAFTAKQCKVIGIAPQHSQKDELAKKAGIETMTIQKFLQLEKSHKLESMIEKENTVILVDESSMLSYKDMLALTYIANRYTARMIFAGDSAQLDSPRSAQPFLHLQQQEGVQVAKLRKIYRQCAIKRPVLHKAIVELTQLKPGEKAHSLTPYLRHNPKHKSLIDTLCETYHKLPQFLQQNCLILTLTNAERIQVNERLQVQTGPHFKQIMLENIDLSKELRYKAAYYAKDSILKFNKEVKPMGIAAQTYWQTVDVNVHENKLTLARCHINKNGRLERSEIITIDPMRKIFHQTNTFEYFKAKEQVLSIGDKVMLTNNIRHQSNRALNTSKQGILKSFNNSHFIIDFGNGDVTKLERNELEHAYVGLGYARTYHNAQSLDARCALLLADCDNRHMLNYAANYVGATRAKQFLRIFTQNKDDYLQLTQKSTQGNIDSINQVNFYSPNKRTIDETKLLNDLSYKIERHAEKLLGQPKAVIKDALIFGANDPNLGITLMTNDTQTIKRGDCLYGGIRFDFITLIEIRKNFTRQQAFLFASETLMGQAIEDYYILTKNDLTKRDMLKNELSLNTRHNIDMLDSRRTKILENEKIQYTQRVKFALSLYQKSSPATGTLAERYLVEHRKIPRSIIKSHSDDIRHIKHNGHNALLFPLRDKNKSIKAVQLVYLDHQTANKTKVQIGHGENKTKLAKQTFGPMKGASIQIGNPYGTPHIAEGPETGLSVLALNPNAKVHITCSLSNMANAPLDIAPSNIIICADNDNINNKTGYAQKSLLSTINKLADKYWEVNVIMPSLINNEKTDFNDLLKKYRLEHAQDSFTNIFKRAVSFNTSDFSKINHEVTTMQKLKKIANINFNMKVEQSK